MHSCEHITGCARSACVKLSLCSLREDKLSEKVNPGFNQDAEFSLFLRFAAEFVKFSFLVNLLVMTGGF